MHTGSKKNSNIIIYIVFGVIIIICVIAFFVMPKSNSKKTEPIANSINFQLIDGDMELNFKEEYKEPGYTCFEGETELTDFVEIANNINNCEPGEYSIIYKCRSKALLRKITVLEPSSYELQIDYSLDKQKYTTEDINITYTIGGETFLEVILPNGERSNELTGNITISSNGTYQIKAYNIRNEEFVKDIVINNIDRENPSGKCEAILRNKKTEITATASDNIGVSKYEYYDNKKLLNNSVNNTYTTTSSTSKNITVKIYDEAGNNKEITCNITDKRYNEPIKPKAGDNVIFQAETDTLKAYVVYQNNYYLTRIWARDAYSQLNKAASPEYGVILYKPVELLKQAMNTNNLQNKLVIGFNASGFYLKDTFDAGSVKKYLPYDKTAVGTIVINNGVVFRNAYDKAVKQWYLVGINKDNKMVIFEDNVASTSEEINNKQAWSKTVINSGIRNTFSFAGPVIMNGKVLTSFSNSMPDPNNKTPKALQLMCQIDENNFVLFTARNINRTVAINEFATMGCQTAFNFDGGGSIALLYKEKNSQNFKTVVGGSRNLPEAAYFTE